MLNVSFLSIPGRYFDRLSLRGQMICGGLLFVVLALLLAGLLNGLSARMQQQKLEQATRTAVAPFIATDVQLTANGPDMGGVALRVANSLGATVYQSQHWPTGTIPWQEIEGHAQLTVGATDYQLFTLRLVDSGLNAQGIVPQAPFAWGWYLTALLVLVGLGVLFVQIRRQNLALWRTVQARLSKLFQMPHRYLDKQEIATLPLAGQWLVRYYEKELRICDANLAESKLTLEKIFAYMQQVNFNDFPAADSILALNGNQNDRHLFLRSLQSLKALVQVEKLAMSGPLPQVEIDLGSRIKHHFPNAILTFPNKRSLTLHASAELVETLLAAVARYVTQTTKPLQISANRAQEEIILEITYAFSQVDSQRDFDQRVLEKAVDLLEGILVHKTDAQESIVQILFQMSPRQPPLFQTSARYEN